MRRNNHQQKKCSLTLEWSSSIPDQLCREYAALRKSEKLQGAEALPEVLEAALFILVDIHSQALACYERGKFHSSYQISTALNGAGCSADSGCTPLGWHRVAEKIGRNESLGTVFKGRVVSGFADDLHSAADDDLITSRILWLSGLQEGVNSGGKVDSFSRYIYIHGTAQEHLIGTAVSHGCIRMRNVDVVEVFDFVDVGGVVFICDDVGVY